MSAPRAFLVAGAGLRPRFRAVRTRSLRPRWVPVVAWAVALAAPAAALDTPNERITLVGLIGAHVVVYDVGGQGERAGLGPRGLQAELEQRLRKAGHEVYAPTLEGCGERHDEIRPGITVGTHGHEVARLLFYEDLENVVLVGTSSGGMVICRAAELAADRIARLVFVDALALLPTERVADIVNRPAANEVTEMTTAPTRKDAESRMFADLEPGMRAWALARTPRIPSPPSRRPWAPRTSGTTAGRPR